MHRALIFAVILFAATLTAFAQDGNTLKLHIKNNETQKGVAAATVTVLGTDLQATADQNGKVEIKGIPNGEQVIEIVSHGYESIELKLNFPLADTAERAVIMKITYEAGEVTVSSTRTGREIEAEPTRVEAIDEEEVDEKINMRPANVSMVLHESTGIQVQQTSPTTNTQSVRIQGLDGRYTQILKDGFPSFGGFSGSLSVLEIPPLDLKQVEVIKGPSATLFGGDAIAGVVNFISKVPEAKPVTSMILNQTSALGTDFSIFNSRKFEKIGYTLLGSVNYQRRFDVDKDDFTELPATRAVSFNPKLFFYFNSRTTLAIGNSTSYQTRKGGDVFVLNGQADSYHQYFEKNKSFRNITTLNFDHVFGDGSRLNAKQSLAFFSRDLTTPNYAFGGRQINSFTDVSYWKVFGKHALIFGGSAVYDSFRERTPSLSPRNETRAAFGAFIQDTVDLNERVSLEAGLRVERTKDYGTFALPRLSFLFRLTDKLTSRVGFGMGYKTPTMFTEEAELLLFRNVLPVGTNLDAEKSKGGTFDLNYRGSIGEKISYSVNQMFFYTEISDPIILRSNGGGSYAFSNAASRIVSKGFETNARFEYGFAKLFLGYTFTDGKAGYLPGTRKLTLLPTHRVNSSLVLEKHENFKAGAELYYGSRQTLDDRSLTRSLVEVGLFGEKTFGKFSLFINAENIFDQRQGRYGQVVFPPHQNPTFAEIYSHTEGRVFNGGIKIRL
ncbi:MAG: TonB-dependent receptor [Acidobacteria bacterium]|nr:TonB-dependent receptor [Acidobacteriota bacterium]